METTKKRKPRKVNKSKVIERIDRIQGDFYNIAFANEDINEKINDIFSRAGFEFDSIRQILNELD